MWHFRFISHWAQIFITSRIYLNSGQPLSNLQCGPLSPNKTTFGMFNGIAMVLFIKFTLRNMALDFTYSAFAHLNYDTRWCDNPPMTKNEWRLNILGELAQDSSNQLHILILWLQVSGSLHWTTLPLWSSGANIYTGSRENIMASCEMTMWVEHEGRAILLVWVATSIPFSTNQVGWKTAL
jgi:hypothetical protein